MKKNTPSLLSAAIALAIGAFAPMGAQATSLSDDGSFTMSGFYNLTAGKVLSGSNPQAPSGSWDYQQWRCPCTIQNWEYAGVYEHSKGWQFDQESLVGLQFNKRFSPNWSATAQFVSRPTDSNSNAPSYIPTLDWAYATYRPTDSNFEFQAGRKRIPLYYYSDFLYINYSYPWARPPADVYGWPIYSYDGANVSYTKDIGDSGWSLTTNAWLGSRQQDNDAYATKIYYTTPTNVAWENMLGAYATVSNGTFEVRAMQMVYHDNVWQNPVGGAPKTIITDNQFTRIRGLAANLDWKNVIVRSEVDRFEQNPDQPNKAVYKYALLGAGYRFATSVGSITPMLTYSTYTTEENTVTAVEGRNTWTLGARWDFKPSMALKIQYDDSKDTSQYPYPFFGDSKLLSISLQGVF